MDHHQVLNFLAICEEMSFSRAAARRFISQQGLSKSVKQLENDLGVPLFIRNHRGLELTEFGAFLRKASESYINQHDYIIDALRQLKDASASHLSIGIAIGSSMVLPPRFFSAFITENPDVKLEIKSFFEDTCLKSVREYNMDLALSPAPIDFSAFDSIHHVRNKLFLAVGKTHPLAGVPSVQLRDLRDEAVISLNTHNHPQLLLTELCMRHGFKPKILLSGSENHIMQELCATGKFVSFFAAPLDEFPGLVRVDIEDMDLYWEGHLVLNKNTCVGKAVERFISYVQKTLGQSF
jgi:DNA-binding transcriptional LysR family regulator